jgi:hypothetical protein
MHHWTTVVEGLLILEKKLEAEQFTYGGSDAPPDWSSALGLRYP